MKITQEQIAQATGISTGSVSELFNGKQPGGKVIRQLVSFGLKPCLVISGTTEEIIESILEIMPAPQPDRADHRIDGSGCCFMIETALAIDYVHPDPLPLAYRPVAELTKTFVESGTEAVLLVVCNKKQDR